MDSSFLHTLYLTTKPPPSTLSIRSRMEHPWEPPAPKATTFTDLATELVEQIATLSWCTGLLALRLVNRDLNSKTLYTFTKAHFTTRSFLLCEISLRTLPRIAEHDTSGRSLKTLTVYDGEILKPEDWLRCWAPAELPFLGDGYNALYEAQQQFQKLKVDLFLVTRIFERLKSFNTTIEVQVQVYGDKHNSGHPTIHGGVAGDKLIWAQNEQSGCRPTKLIVEALASSGFSPSKFTVHGHGWWRSLYIFPKAWGLNHNIVRRPDHIKMFNGLEHLNLVDVLLTPGDGHALRSMSGILAASSILETLTLSGREIKQIDRKSILYSRYYDRSGNCLPPPLRLSMKCSRLKTLRVEHLQLGFGNICNSSVNTRLYRRLRQKIVDSCRLLLGRLPWSRKRSRRTSPRGETLRTMSSLSCSRAARCSEGCV